MDMTGFVNMAVHVYEMNEIMSAYICICVTDFAWMEMCECICMTSDLVSALLLDPRQVKQFYRLLQECAIPL